MTNPEALRCLKRPSCASSSATSAPIRTQLRHVSRQRLDIGETHEDRVNLPTSVSAVQFLDEVLRRVPGSRFKAAPATSSGTWSRASWIQIGQGAEGACADPGARCVRYRGCRLSMIVQRDHGDDRVLDPQRGLGRRNAPEVVGCRGVVMRRELGPRTAGARPMTVRAVRRLSTVESR